MYRFRRWKFLYLIIEDAEFFLDNGMEVHTWKTFHNDAIKQREEEKLMQRKKLAGTPVKIRKSKKKGKEEPLRIDLTIADLRNMLRRMFHNTGIIERKMQLREKCII